MMKSKENLADTNKRQEIVEQAFDVFYRNGFHAAGVNSLLEGSGISKRTLYKYFDSKEDLIQATVEHYKAIAFQRIYEFVENARVTNPQDKILKIFDWLENLIASGHRLGCFAINAKLEFAGRDKNIEGACENYFVQVESYIEKLCKEAHVKNAKKVAGQIALIFQGAIVNGQITRSPESIRIAKSAAQAVLSSALKS